MVDFEPKSTGAKIARASIGSNPTVRVGSGGKVSLTNTSADSTELIADVTGYYRSGTRTNKRAPCAASASAFAGALVIRDARRRLESDGLVRVFCNRVQPPRRRVRRTHGKFTRSAAPPCRSS